MYILAHHIIHDPANFWAGAQAAMPNIPAGVTLHQTLSASDGTRATCLWEAASIDVVRELLQPLDAFATNELRAAENRDGVAVPTRFLVAAVSA